MMNDIWNKVLEQLKIQLTKPTFEMFFKNTKSLHEEDQLLSISVPSEFVKDWLQTKYSSLIISSIISITGKEIDVEYMVQELRNEPNFRDRETDENQQNRDFRPCSLNERYTFQNFIVGNSNRFAHAACRSIAESPGYTYNPLFIYGGVGLGKTHLLQAVAHRAIENGCKRVIYTTSEKFTNELIFSIQVRKMKEFHDFYRTVDFLIIDDIQFLSGKERTQEEFFHTFNTLYDAKKQIALSSDRPPKDLDDIAERLKTRFQMGLSADVQAPDYETRVAILRNKAEIEELDVPDEVLDFIANQPFTNIRDLEGTLIRLLAYASLNNKEISIDLTKEVLKDLVPFKNKVVTAEDIKKIVGEYFNIQSSELETKKRNQDISTPRQIAIYLIREFTDYSLPMIGKFFGGRDHSTIIHSYEKIKKEMDSNETVKAAVAEITNKLRYI
jgi:chromosomal replication initiator protein